MKTAPRRIISVITLVFFFTTLSAFVAWRSGAFGHGVERTIHAMMTGGEGMSFVESDSPGADSAKPQVMIPSSKVMILSDEQRYPEKKDTAKKKNAGNANGQANGSSNNNANANPAPPVYMNSTKSGGVFPVEADTQQQQKPKR